MRPRWCVPTGLKCIIRMRVCDQKALVGRLALRGFRERLEQVAHQRTALGR